MKLTLWRQALFVVAIPLLVEIVFVTIFATLLNEVKLQRAREIHARDLAYEVNCLMRTFLKRGTIVLLGKLQAGDPEKLSGQFQSERAIISRQLSKIQNLVEKHPRQKAIFEKIVSQKDEFNSLMRQALRLTLEGKRSEAAAVFPRGQEILEGVMALSDQMIEEQQDTELKEYEAQNSARLLIESTLIGLLVTSVFLALFLISLFNRSALSRLAILSDNITLLGSGSPLNPEISGTDEIADLGAAFLGLAVELDSLEEKEKAIIDNSADVICALDSDGRFITASAAAEMHWAYAPEELTGVELGSILHEDNEFKALDALRRIADNGTTLTTKIRRKDGLIVDMQWTARRSQGPGDNNAIYCIAHNVTARTEIEQLKSDFVAMVSHDLRTPLTSIQLAHGLFINGAYGELDDEGLQAIEAADAGVDRLLELVNQILDIEKWEAGRLTIETEPIAIDAIVDTAMRSARELSKQKGVFVKVLPHESVIVLADEKRAAEALEILLRNAVNSSIKGESVSLAVHTDDQVVTLSVSDSGPSIAEQEGESIFDRFAGLENTHGREGIGLRLAVCKAIVSLHGGNIGADSSDETKCTFWFTLPLPSATLT